jgi:hypothetical protein
MGESVPRLAMAEGYEDDQPRILTTGYLVQQDRPRI